MEFSSIILARAMEFPSIILTRATIYDPSCTHRLRAKTIKYSPNFISTHTNSIIESSRRMYTFSSRIPGARRLQNTRRPEKGTAMW